MCLPGLFGGSTPAILKPPPPIPKAPERAAENPVSGTNRRQKEKGSLTSGTSLTIPTPLNIP